MKKNSIKIQKTLLIFEVFLLVFAVGSRWRNWFVGLGFWRISSPYVVELMEV